MGKYKDPYAGRRLPDDGLNAAQRAAYNLYGFLGGALGTAPDEFERGSVLDPHAVERDAAVRGGADVGFTVGTAAQVAPVIGGALKWANAGGKVGGALSKYMQATGMELNAVPKSSGAFDLSDPLRSPTVLQSEVPRYDPPRGVPQRVQDLMANKKAFNKAANWTADGMTEDGLGWYNMEPLRNEFVKRLGEKEGTQRFNQYIDLMAATSAGAKTDSNARIASYYFVNGKYGAEIPIPPKGSGYGHKAQQLHNRNANEILSGGGLDPIQHPNRFTFAENLKGNQEPVTVDKHNIRMWGMSSEDPAWVAGKLEDPKGAGAPGWWEKDKHGPWTPTGFNPREFVTKNDIAWKDIPATWFEGAPTKTEYGALEQLNKKLAEKFGTSPAATQAASWLGAGPTTGLGSPPKSMMNTFDELLSKRSAVRGETPESILDQLIRRQAPLAVGGLSGLLGYELLQGEGKSD